MLSVKTLFAYLFYVLLAVVGFMYLLFPDPAVRAYITDRVTAVDPALTMSMEPIRPTLTAGLKSAAIDLDRDGVRLLHLDNVRVTPDLLKLLKNRRQGRFTARWAQGTASGMAALNDGAWRVETDMQGVRLDRLGLAQALHADDRFSLSGELAGRITHGVDSPPSGTTNGALTITGLSIGLSTPVAGIDKVDMNRTTVEFTIKAATLQVKTVTFDGPLLEGRISGSIQLKTPFGQSRLNLSGTAKPRPELIAKLQDTLPTGLINTRSMGTRGLPFRIRGTIDNPDVAMR
jgi:type II secretion system protein N